MGIIDLPEKLAQHRHWHGVDEGGGGTKGTMAPLLIGENM